MRPSLVALSPLWSRAVVLLLVLSGASVPAVAQNPTNDVGLAVQVTASTFGLGVDLATGSKKFVIRKSRTFGILGTDRTIEGIRYHVTADSDLTGLTAEVHPFGGGFLVAYGRLTNKSVIRLASTPAAGRTIRVNETDYAADSVGTLSGVVAFPGKSSYYGVGWDRTFTKPGRMEFVARVGVLRQDAPTLALTANGPLAQQPQFAAALEAERADTEASFDMRVARNVPMLSLGLSYRLF